MSDVGGEPADRSSGSAIVSRRQRLAVSFAHGFEFYDFTVYGFFAVPIGRTFFPVADPWTSLLLALVGYGVGFGARPLGALCFGFYADRRGRKPAMLMTIAVMAASTLAMALLPGHAALGIASPVLLVVLRLVQGFALGGEIGPSSTYLLETAPPGRRASILSWQYTLNGAAVLAAGLVGEGLSLALPGAMLEAFGWRIALLLGLGLVPLGLAIRSGLPAPPTPHRPPRESRSLVANPVPVLAAILVIGSGTVVYAVGSFLTSFALTALHLPPRLAFWSPTALGVATMVFAPVGGRLADRFGGRRTLLLSRLGLVVAAIPAFAWLRASSSGLALLVVSGGLAALSTLGAAAGLHLIIEGMPVRSRALGLALVYTLGIALFGGTAQLAAAALTAWGGGLLSPAYLVVAAGLVGAAAAFGLPDTTGDGAPLAG